MQADAYQEYLKTDAWKSLCVQAMARAGGRCQVCNSPDQINTHHRTYERIGAESLDDLTVLCERCHHLFHESSEANVTAEKLDSEFQPTPECAIPTGLTDLDRYISGFRLGEFAVVSGGPMIGKSAFLHHMLRQNINQGSSAILFSTEHRVNQVWARLPKDKGESHIWVDDHHRQTIMRIVAHCRQLKRESNLHCVIVDSLDMVESNGFTKSDQIANACMRMKSLARELGVAVIASTSIDRKTLLRQDSIPRLDDLKSPSIEQCADVVILLSKPEFGDDKTRLRLEVSKQRHGPAFEIDCRFNRMLIRFENYEYQQ